MARKQLPQQVVGSLLSDRDLARSEPAPHGRSFTQPMPKRRQPMRKRTFQIAALALAAGLFALPAGATESTDLLVAEGLVSQEVATGANLFFRGTFGGNGRTCGTCHPVDNNQTIDADFIATLPASDPLFIAEQTVGNGGVPGLERPALMRQFGLILENVDGFEDPEVKFVMRSVPHTLSLAVTIDAPNDGRPQEERTGWSGDGAPSGDPDGDGVDEIGTLRMFSAGAVKQHFTKSLDRTEGVDFQAPTLAQLNAMRAYMLSVGRLNDIDISPASLTLNNATADLGRNLFRDGVTAKCRFCHRQAGANSAQVVGGIGNHNMNTGVEDVANPAQGVETFPGDGGFGTGLLGGLFGDGTFNAPPLIEAADTGPFFHNNVRQTLEQAVAFYSSAEFNNSPGAALVGGISLTPQQSDAVAAFLRVLNAAFNIKISLQRNNAAASILKKQLPIPCDPLIGCPEPPPDPGPTANSLATLSSVEALDAIDVLSDVGLHPTAVTRLGEAVALNEQAVNAANNGIRKQRILEAVNKLNAALTDLGSGFSFTLGEGNLLF